MGDISTINLKNFGKKVFLQTGTFKGAGVKYALTQDFDEIYSIQIMKQYYNLNVQQFKDSQHIKILNGNSYQILKQLLPSIKQDIVFWLDAHFPGADGGLTSYTDQKDIDKRIPLQRQMQIISQRIATNKDVIIIDDLWLYQDGPFEWGNVQQHMRNCHKGQTRQQLTNNRKLDNVYKMFQSSHKVHKLYRHQGYLIFIPR